MLRLVRYIGFNCVHIGRADTEGAIALLPSKFDSVLADPARRICFEYLDSDAEGNCCRQGKQNMRVIRRATCREDWNVMVLSNPAEILPEFRL